MADKRRDTKGRIIPMFQDVKKHFWKRSARKRILIGNPLLLTVIPDSSFWMQTVRCTRRRGSSIKPKSSLLIIIRRLCARRRKRESHAWSRRSAHTFFVIPFARWCVRSRQIPRLSRNSWVTKYPYYDECLQWSNLWCEDRKLQSSGGGYLFGLKLLTPITKRYMTLQIRNGLQRNGFQTFVV